MTYVPGFDHDVFISYPHAENTQDGDAPGWVSQFAVDLDRQLARRTGGTGRRVSLWRDPRLVGNHCVNQTIENAVKSSALIISVLCPAYVDSTWCLDAELRTFVKQSHAIFGRFIGTYSRVFRVGSLGLNLASKEKLIGDPDLRFLLDDLTGFDFFEVDPFTFRERPFRRTRPEDPDQRYHQRVADLAHAVIDTLGAMVARIQAANSASAPQSTSVAVEDGPIVYIAQSADDVSDQRDQLVRELEAHGVCVLPKQPLPPNEPQLSQAVNSLVATARLGVHLFGQFYGQIPNGGTRSIPHTQFEAVLRRAASRDSSCSQLVWIPSDLDSSKCQPKQTSFLAAVENGIDGWTPEILKTGVEQLKDSVLRKLASRASKTKVSSDEARPLVYIACLPGDKPLADQLSSFLKDARTDVMVALRTSDAKLRLKHFKSNVGASDGVLVLYESADPLWVTAQVMEIRKIAERRRRRALRARAVYEGPPPGRLPLGLHFERWQIIDCRNGHSALSLSDFVAELRKRNST